MQNQGKKVKQSENLISDPSWKVLKKFNSANVFLAGSLEKHFC